MLISVSLWIYILFFCLQCDYFSIYIRTQVAEPEKKSAVAILSNLLYNNLAKLMNLEGGNNKIAFRSLNIFKVFEGVQHLLY